MADHGDPDDAALLAVLDTEAAGAWRRLVELDRDFRARPHAEDDYVWPSVGDGQMPYPIYGARVDAVCRVLGEVRAVTPAYHWMQHEPPVLSDDGTVSAADAVRLATTIVRGERFGDGTVGAALARGTLQAAVAALADWYRRQAERPV